MKVLSQWDVWEHAVKLAENVVHHGLAIAIFSVLGFVTATLIHRWKQSMYGTRVVVRVCWVENKQQFSQVIGSGDALAMTGSKDVAATLVKAYKKCNIGKVIAWSCWTDEKAQRALRRICEGISERFAQGAIARAMHDKDVTAGHFHVAAFRRENTVSVILALGEDLKQFREEGLGTISGSGPELSEMSDLSAYVSARWSCLYSVVLYQ